MKKENFEKIKDIIEEHLSIIEVDKVASSNDQSDWYLLGKWDLAQEINDVLLKEESGPIMKQLNLLYRKVMYFFSKKDIEAILKYDPLNILQESESKK